MRRVRVAGEALDHADDTLAYLDSERFTGIAEDRFPDGSLQHETEYRNGILDGVARTYWPDGGVRDEAWYDYGILLRRRRWYENGVAERDVVLADRGLKHDYRWNEDGSTAGVRHWQD